MQQRRLWSWVLGVAVALPLAGGMHGCATAPHPQGWLPEDESVGLASWYGQRHHGRTTASGEPFDMYEMTAAHRTLPFGTVVRVTLQEEDARAVDVRINDRGPKRADLVIDLSWAAAQELGILKRGVAPVVVEVIEWAE